MVRNKEKYQQAIGLRKRGFTLVEIAKYCDISKSTASKWLKNKLFSESVTKQNKRRAGLENVKRLKLINKAKLNERRQRYLDAERSAKIEFKNYQSNPIFLPALTAYLASGDVKSERDIRFSHVSPELHRLIIKFCINFLGIDKEKIHLWLHLYGSMSEEKSMKKWSKITTIPYSQFYKNQFINNNAAKVLHDGVGNTIICNTYHKRKLKVWLNLAIKKW
ncbi:helix-turn-helix domain-containing protein [Candidatus Kaiserbacteria bacterium]|nr:helix-turn-helix domain-containing protein [Candidatus Kaiserbacteria bacterium]